MDHPCPPSLKGHVNDQGHAVNSRCVAWARPGGCRPALGSGPLKVSSGTRSPLPAAPAEVQAAVHGEHPKPRTLGAVVAGGGRGQGAYHTGGLSSWKDRAGTGVTAFSPCLRPHSGRPPPPLGFPALGASGLQMPRGRPRAKGRLRWVGRWGRPGAAVNAGDTTRGRKPS